MLLSTQGTQCATRPCAGGTQEPSPVTTGVTLDPKPHSPHPCSRQAHTYCPGQVVYAPHPGHEPGLSRTARSNLLVILSGIQRLWTRFSRWRGSSSQRLWTHFSRWRGPRRTKPASPPRAKAEQTRTALAPRTLHPPHMAPAQAHPVALCPAPSWFLGHGQQPGVRQEWPGLIGNFCLLDWCSVTRFPGGGRRRGV